MTTATQTPRRDEARNVRSWRYCSLRRAGYPKRAAAELARARDVDLHRALALREAACPVETALAILR
jgi:hypothetical protein